MPNLLKIGNNYMNVLEYELFSSKESQVMVIDNKYLVDVPCFRKQLGSLKALHSWNPNPSHPFGNVIHQLFSEEAFDFEHQPSHTPVIFDKRISQDKSKLYAIGK